MTDNGSRFINRTGTAAPIALKTRRPVASNDTIVAYRQGLVFDGYWTEDASLYDSLH